MKNLAKIVQKMTVVGAILAQKTFWLNHANFSHKYALKMKERNLKDNEISFGVTYADKLKS